MCVIKFLIQIRITVMLIKCVCIWMCITTACCLLPFHLCVALNIHLYLELFKWFDKIIKHIRFKVARARTRRKNTFPIHTFKTLIYRSNWRNVSTILFLFHQNLWNNTKYQKIRSILHFVSMDTKWDSPW